MDGVEVVDLGLKEVCFDALTTVREDRLGREVSFCVSGQVRESELEYIGSAAVLIFKRMESSGSEVSWKTRDSVIVGEEEEMRPVSRVDRMRSCAVETLTLLLKYLVAVELYAT